MLRNHGLLVKVTFNTSLSYKNVRLGSVLSGKEELSPPPRFGRLALILSINEKALLKIYKFD